MDMENLIGKKKFSLGQNASTILFLLLFIALFGAILSFATPNFLTAYNVGVIFKQMSFFGVAALGQTLVLIIGGIDLSIGSTACLSGILFALCMTKTGMHPLLAVVICVIAGALMGYINGLFITKLKLHPFIVTLAASNIGYGFVLVISEGYTISGITGKVLTIGQGMLGPIPVPTVIFIVFVAILTYILKCTPFGRELFAIGGNAAASRLVGINVESRTRLVYLLSGAFAAFAGSGSSGMVTGSGRYSTRHLPSAYTARQSSSSFSPSFSHSFSKISSGEITAFSSKSISSASSQASFRSVFLFLFVT